MDRRAFVKLLSATLPMFACGCMKFHSKEHSSSAPVSALDDLGAQGQKNVVPPQLKNDLKTKSVYFDNDFADDVFCPVHDKKHLHDLIDKFRAVQNHVGYGHFNLLGMDDFFYLTKYTSKISPITKKEKDLIELIFNQDAKRLGFYGDKVFKRLSEEVSKNKVVKIAKSGHYLRKGKSLEIYNKIVKDTDHSLILTSGVRGLAKQFHLFLEKTEMSGGNYSRASRSLAPPGYSFHGQNDFDIGKVGFGLHNFTDDFANTREFKILCDLGYVDIRYKEKNTLGVRFEPWHIQIS